jgi:hypothetical protein
MFWFAWLCMVVFKQQGGYVCIHGKAAGSLGVIPRDINACKFGARPVSGDCVMLLEGVQEVFSMSAFSVLDAKVIDNEDKPNRPPFMTPNAGGS